jgi:hypothetical protein
MLRTLRETDFESDIESESDDGTAVDPQFKPRPADAD